MLGLIIVTLLALASRGNATCKTPEHYPANLPLIGCPRSAEDDQGLCLRCLKDQRSYKIYYDAPASQLVTDWEKALVADGWTVKHEPSSKAALHATKKDQVLSVRVFTGGTDEWKPYTPQLQGQMVFALFHR